MGARDYMFGLLDDPAIMARVHEARDRFLEFRSFWAERHTEAIDLTQLDHYFDSFETRARKTFERMCDDCTFTVTNGTSVHNPYRESRRRRQERGYDLKGRRVQFAEDSIQEPGPNQLCLECENAWLDELQYGWELYCMRRIDCIGWGVPKDKPLGYCKCRRLPGNKYMWYSYAIPGYTKEEAFKIHSTKESLSYYLGEIVEQKTKKDFLTRHKEFQEKYKKVHVRKELLRHDIKVVISEDIAQDGERLALWEAGSEERSSQVRAEIRAEFISRTLELYGKAVVDQISPSDITEYCTRIEAGDDSDDSWHSLFAKYDFDQNTDSCLYFIRQGEAVKIGITDNLDQRFSQIKTSAAFPCKIENVVYTHHGQVLERKLHRTLACYKNHLEWFILPPELQRTLFAAKSVEDIERALRQIGHKGGAGGGQES